MTNEEKAKKVEIQRLKVRILEQRVYTSKSLKKRLRLLKEIKRRCQAIDLLMKEVA